MYQLSGPDLLQYWVKYNKGNIYDVNEGTIDSSLFLKQHTEILQEEKNEDEETIVEFELDSYLLQ